jgi:hypothetical protein
MSKEQMNRYVRSSIQRAKESAATQQKKTMSKKNSVWPKVRCSNTSDSPKTTNHFSFSDYGELALDDRSTPASCPPMKPAKIIPKNSCSPFTANEALISPFTSSKSFVSKTQQLEVSRPFFTPPDDRHNRQEHSEKYDKRQRHSLMEDESSSTLWVNPLPRFSWSSLDNSQEGEEECSLASPMIESKLPIVIGESKSNLHHSCVNSAKATKSGIEIGGEKKCSALNNASNSQDPIYQANNRIMNSDIERKISAKITIIKDGLFSDVLLQAQEGDVSTETASASSLTSKSSRNKLMRDRYTLKVAEDPEVANMTLESTNGNSSPIPSNLANEMKLNSAGKAASPSSRSPDPKAMQSPSLPNFIEDKSNAESGRASTSPRKLRLQAMMAARRAALCKSPPKEKIDVNTKSEEFTLCDSKNAIPGCSTSPIYVTEVDLINNHTQSRQYRSQINVKNVSTQPERSATHNHLPEQLPTLVLLKDEKNSSEYLTMSSHASKDEQIKDPVIDRSSYSNKITPATTSDLGKYHQLVHTSSDKKKHSTQPCAENAEFTMEECDVDHSPLPMRIREDLDSPSNGSIVDKPDQSDEKEDQKTLPSIPVDEIAATSTPMTTESTPVDWHTKDDRPFVENEGKTESARSHSPDVFDGLLLTSSDDNVNSIPTQLQSLDSKLPPKGVPALIQETDCESMPTIAEPNEFEIGHRKLDKVEASVVLHFTDTNEKGQVIAPRESSVLPISNGENETSMEQPSGLMEHSNSITKPCAVLKPVDVAIVSSPCVESSSRQTVATTIEDQSGPWTRSDFGNRPQSEQPTTPKWSHNRQRTVVGEKCDTRYKDLSPEVDISLTLSDGGLAEAAKVEMMRSRPASGSVSIANSPFAQSDDESLEANQDRRISHTPKRKRAIKRHLPLHHTTFRHSVQVDSPAQTLRRSNRCRNAGRSSRKIKKYGKPRHDEGDDPSEVIVTDELLLAIAAWKGVKLTAGDFNKILESQSVSGSVATRETINRTKGHSVSFSPHAITASKMQISSQHDEKDRRSKFCVDFMDILDLGPDELTDEAGSFVDDESSKLFSRSNLACSMVLENTTNSSFEETDEDSRISFKEKNIFDSLADKLNTIMEGRDSESDMERSKEFNLRSFSFSRGDQSDTEDHTSRSFSEAEEIRQGWFKMG